MSLFEFSHRKYYRDPNVIRHIWDTKKEGKKVAAKERLREA